jgi:hypothetical protein
MNYSALFVHISRLGLLLFLTVFAVQCIAQGNEDPQIKTPPKPPVQDIFAVRTWAPAQVEPETVKEVQPKRPQVPQLPFRFIGKIADPDKSMAFLLGKGDRIMSVSVGDVIGGIYLVEKYERAHLYFIYKPMKARQSLFVGSAS